MDAYTGSLRFTTPTDAAPVPESRIRVFAYEASSITVGGSGLCLGNFGGKDGMALRTIYDVLQSLIYGGLRHNLIGAIWLLPLQRETAGPDAYGRFAHLVANSAAAYAWVVVLHDANECSIAFDKLLLELCGKNLRDLAQENVARKRSRNSCEEHHTVDKMRSDAKRGISSSIYSSDALAAGTLSHAGLIVSPLDLEYSVCKLLPVFRQPTRQWAESHAAHSLFQVVLDKKEQLNEDIAGAFVAAFDCPLKPSIFFNYRHWKQALGGGLLWDSFFDDGAEEFRPAQGAMLLNHQNWNNTASAVSTQFSRFHLGTDGEGVTRKSYVLGAAKYTGTSIPLGVPGTETLNGGPETRIMYGAMRVLGREIHELLKLDEETDLVYHHEGERRQWQRAMLDGPARAAYAKDAPASDAVRIAYQFLNGVRDDGQRDNVVVIPRHTCSFDGSLLNFLEIFMEDLDLAYGVSGTHIHGMRLFFCARPFRAVETDGQRALSLSQHGTSGDGKTFLLKVYNELNPKEQQRAVTRLTCAFEDGIRRTCTEALSMTVVRVDEGPHAEMARPDTFGKETAEIVEKRSRWKERTDEGTGAAAGALKAMATQGQGTGEERTAQNRDTTYIITSNHSRAILDDAFKRRFVFSYVVPHPRADGAAQSELDQRRDMKRETQVKNFWAHGVGRIALLFDDLASSRILEFPSVAAVVNPVFERFVRATNRHIGIRIPYSNQHIHNVRRTAHQIGVLRAVAATISDLPSGPTQISFATNELFLRVEERMQVEPQLALFACGLVMKDFILWPPLTFCCAYACATGVQEGERIHAKHLARVIQGSDKQIFDGAATIMANEVQKWLQDSANQRVVNAQFDKPHSQQQLKDALVENGDYDNVKVRAPTSSWNPDTGKWSDGTVSATKLERRDDGATWLSFDTTWATALMERDETFRKICVDAANGVSGPIAAYHHAGAGKKLMVI